MPYLLPPVARRRLERLAPDRPGAALETSGDVAALRSVGFDPVGEVLGCVALAPAPHTNVSCGYVRRPTRSGIYPMTARPNTYRGPRTQQLTSCYQEVLKRLRAEAAARGADGVVGITIAAATAQGALLEFVATGTAVRTTGSVPAPRELRFTTHLRGADVAALLLGGWAPVAMHAVVDTRCRHDDVATMTQAAVRWANQANVEVTGFTEVQQQARVGARRKLLTQYGRAGADGGLLATLNTVTWHQHCAYQEASDRVVECVAFGSSITRFAGLRTPSPQPLTFLPLTDASSAAGVRA